MLLWSEEQICYCQLWTNTQFVLKWVFTAAVYCMLTQNKLRCPCLYIFFGQQWTSVVQRYKIYHALNKQYFVSRISSLFVLVFSWGLFTIRKYSMYKFNQNDYIYGSFITSLSLSLRQSLSLPSNSWLRDVHSSVFWSDFAAISTANHVVTVKL